MLLLSKEINNILGISAKTLVLFVAKENKRFFKNTAKVVLFKETKYNFLKILLLKWCYCQKKLVKIFKKDVGVERNVI